MLYPASGQYSCHGILGRELPCAGTGQDGAYRRGTHWPVPRYREAGDLVQDRLTGLVWPKNALLAEFPLNWEEALEFVRGLNLRALHGYRDWRLPNRRELRSLVSYQTRRPALPEGHPFENVFSGWYWSSTTAAMSPAHAWCVHMEGARMFFGGKDQYYMVWPVRGHGNGLLAATGQKECHDSRGQKVPCHGTGQDGELRFGHSWPRPRFVSEGQLVLDRLSGLYWSATASLTADPVAWEEALAMVRQFDRADPGRGWRLPNVNELETLVDCSRAAPALPGDAPFSSVQQGYWSSTTSMFEPDWAWALYMDKGAVGVGQKKGRHFHLWAVCDPASAGAASAGLPTLPGTGCQPDGFQEV